MISSLGGAIFAALKAWVIRECSDVLRWYCPGKIGGFRTFAAVRSNGSNAQIATFAKSRGRPKADMQAFRDKCQLRVQIDISLHRSFVVKSISAILSFEEAIMILLSSFAS